MRLIIAEKPSQARDYANALNESFSRKDGYLQSNNTFITWCFGHLIELARDTTYRNSTSWSKDYLPLLPSDFKYVIGTDNNKKTDTGKKKQLNIIASLMKQSTSIINGTDADREGELIFLYVYNYLKCNLPYKRLWISSLTSEEIRNGFNNLKSKNEHHNLGRSGYARAITDWLVGINATQSATLQLGNRNLLSIGRVQTTILKIICERYLKNKSHNKTYTYQIHAKHKEQGISFQSSSDIFQTENEINSILNRLDTQKHLFLKLEEKFKKKNPPLLHSIDSLIIEANKKLKYSSKETLSIAQSLYEKKLTTYPRTDSQYINEEGCNKIKKFINTLSKKVLNYDNFNITSNTPKSVNAKKITGSHDAIVPTGSLINFYSLTQKEQNIYKLVLCKCLESFSTPAIYKKKTYFFINEGYEFKTNSNQLTTPGFLAFSFQSQYRGNIEKTSIDIELRPNQYLSANFEINKIESKPPALYTDATLTPDLTNIGKFLIEENPELLEELKGKIDLDNVQIGTQATRPIIIEKLIKIGFIEKRKNNLIPSEKGLAFYEIIKGLKVTNVAYTAILEKELSDISNGILTEDKYYERLTNYVSKIVEDIFSIEIKLQLNTSKSVGSCPKCKEGNIVLGKTKKSYGCDRYKDGCNFIFGSHFAKKKLTEKNIKDLLSKGKTSLIKGFKSRKDKPFDAYLKTDNDYKIKFEYKK